MIVITVLMWPAQAVRGNLHRIDSWLKALACIKLTCLLRSFWGNGISICPTTANEIGHGARYYGAVKMVVSFRSQRYGTRLQRFLAIGHAVIFRDLNADSTFCVHYPLDVWHVPTQTCNESEIAGTITCRHSFNGWAFFAFFSLCRFKSISRCLLHSPKVVPCFFPQMTQFPLSLWMICQAR